MTKKTKRVAVASAAVALSIAFPPAARSQTVSDVLNFLITNRSLDTGDFDRDRAAAQATSDTIRRALLANLATLPTPNASSAFVYRLNPTLGTEERATSTFGPFFVQRALTAGARQASVGLSFQHLRFSSLDGRDLSNGTLVTTANQFADESAPFDVDRLALTIDADIATLYGTIGVAPRVEIGFAVPMTTLRISGSRVDTYRGTAFTQAAGAATALGLADAVLRSKVLAYDEGGMALALGAEVRLPTGRAQDLLGTGTTSLRLTIVGSHEAARTSTHVNFGYEVGGLARETVYGAAFTAAATRSLTAGIELAGRRIDGLGSITTAVAPHPRLAGVETLRLVSDGSAGNVVSVAPGLKWNAGGTWVLSGSVVVPVTHDGLTARFTPYVSVDWAR